MFQWEAMDKVTGQCPQTTTFFEEKGEPKRIRTEVLPLTSLITPLPLGQTGSQVSLAPVKASVKQAPAVWLCAERAKHDRCRVRLAVLLSAGYSCVTRDWSTQ